jgi:hypothetical protein
VAVAALIMPLNVLLGTGLLPGWGHWYGSDLTYRRQTDAMLRGSVAIGEDPGDLDWDWVWWNGEAHQVWGLGVPLWRLPFEFFARVVDRSAFPDRLAFGAAIAATMYLLMSAFLPRGLSGDPLTTLRRRPAAVLAPLVLIHYPPFLNLCRTRFWTYEEAQAYAYLAALCLTAVTIVFAQRPTLKRYVLLGILSGLSSFVRPTLVFYGGASMAAALVKAWACRWPLGRILAGPLAFALGCALLGASNYERFGSPLEVGHRLNLNTIDRMRYTSRFADPYADEPWTSAATELFSALFFGGNSFNGNDWYAEQIFVGQSGTLRWREFYFSTFGAGTLALIVASWSWGSIRLWKQGAAEIRRAGRAVPSVLIIWSIAATVPLWFFYLRCPFVASRYLLDFAPGFAAACTAGLFALREVVPASWTRKGTISTWMFLMVGVGWSYAVLTSQILDDDKLFSPGVTLTSQQLQKKWLRGFQTSTDPPENYEVGMTSDRSLFLNGAGWNSKSGRTKCSALFFVPEVRTIELTVTPAEVDEEPDYTTIRARIGLQELQLQSTVATTDGMKLTFGWPANVRPPTGVQVVFFGLATPAELDRDYSRFRVLRVSWDRAR